MTPSSGSDHWIEAPINTLDAARFAGADCLSARLLDILRLVGADVTGWSLGPAHTALVCGRTAGGTGASMVDGRAAGQEGHGLGRYTIVLQGTEQRVGVRDVGRLRETA